jgi:hypothetical protein
MGAPRACVWVKEYRKRLTQPFEDLRVQLKEFKRHCKHHEETYGKRTGIYRPLDETLDADASAGFADKQGPIHEAETFTHLAERAYMSIPFLTKPENMLVGYPQFRRHLTGNKLDEEDRGY